MPDQTQLGRPQTGPQLAERFDGIAAYEVGIEDEVMLLDPETLDLTDRAVEVLALTDHDPRFKLELPASQLEIITSPQSAVRPAVESLLCARRALAAASAGRVQLAAAGVHPCSPGVGRLNPGERYERIARAYGCVAERQLVCALQVHVSVGESDRALAVYNAARSFLPLLAALAANAPFYEGADTQLASVRPEIANLLPRQGVPPAFTDWDELAGMLSWGESSSALNAPDTWWWELRLHPRFGTLEFRVPDAQSTAREAAAMTALAQALVAWLGGRHDAGEALPIHPRWKIEENRWSASRDGVAGEMVDLATQRRRPTRALLESLIETLAPTAGALGCTPELSFAAEMLDANGAIRQRRAAEHGGTLSAARLLVERFLEPLDG